jgi:glycosyltransferase involved in cell wall biosynthesis
MPAVLTLHDCIALSNPDFATPGSANIQKRLLPKSAKLARRVMVPSEAVKAEALRFLELKPEKIDVVPWGVGPEFKPIEDEALLEQAQKQWSLPDPFVLYVGTLEPKKNLRGLLRSFVAAKLNLKLPHSVVIVGRNGWGMRNFPRDIQDHGAREYVYLTGYVPEAALPLLYSMADLCVLPSHIEGFGMPVLEAMACGCPVLVSDTPALVEVAGGAARVCRIGGDKPYQEMREAFEELLGQKASEKARYALRGRGLQRAKQFTWQQTAELTHKCYEQALG